MAYTKETKSGGSFSKVADATNSFIVHLYDALLCEDGSYLLQETGDRINLEWFSTLTTKPTTVNTGNVKPVTVWTT